ncbi:hypothetical protein HPB48_000379 [Haemaphysalis longicornis]|uniref:Reverse transcriptase domain-containing protein n=1 Tax=Haemaphysalis longicornis TaxID=44386 RepID=A0A9J6FYN8_HAELO|nr:hypothetical protein HPB48_000379 [Haemaphysalis longicornis]
MLLSTVINRIIQKYSEGNKLADAQIGFRPDRRTSHHIFTINQAIEMKHKDKSRIFLAFPDMKKAYDTVSHARQWEVTGSQYQHWNKARVPIIPNAF